MISKGLLLKGEKIDMYLTAFVTGKIYLVKLQRNVLFKKRNDGGNFILKIVCYLRLS